MSTQMAKMTSKGQLTLPKAIRDKLNLDKGSYVAIYLEKDQIVMKKVNPHPPLSDADPIWDMLGMFHKAYSEESPNKIKESKVTAIWEAAGWKQYS